MDYVFFLEEEARAALLRVICRVLGCAYICLWSNPFQSSNFLIYKDGWYNEEESDQTGGSSVSATLVHRLFNAYKGTVCNIQTGFVPGYVSREGLPFLELRDSELFTLAAVDIQRQFYQEARIKLAVFLGCGSGEIELGMSTPRNINLQMEVTNLLTEIIHQSSQLGELPQPGTDQSRPSSSSSSLMSLSMGSPEKSSLVFTIPNTTSSYQLPVDPLRVDHISTPLITRNKATRPININITTSTSPSMNILPPYQQQRPMQAYGGAARNRNALPPFRIPASDDAAMTRAMLAVISSPSSSSSSFQTTNTPPRTSTGAFRPYVAALRVMAQVKSNLQRDNMLKRAFSFLRSMPRTRIEAPAAQETRPSPNQLHHMFSERRRREKLNEYFDTLRGLLPPGIKKHKASVLSSTIETLGSLKAKVSELTKENTALQARLDQEPNNSKQEATEVATAVGNERVGVEIVEASEASSSSEREIELQVTVREDVCSLMDLAIRLLERLKQMNNVVGVLSMDARTQFRDSGSFHRVTIRLRIQASDWEEQTFKEAMTRAAAEEDDDAAH
ncbi:hypothetical protein H6P81_000220 [Aristolochia fimbriata]|uniref:BHLH domain-containing protein n=1 Tax=Aristolochia fimbriata TaxID=158543 RepID=A0AAV7F6T8_ARIFI|nr:hypothetical protein H6P81_000220 [Aristolochia fimbriata]